MGTSLGYAVLTQLKGRCDFNQDREHQSQAGNYHPLNFIRMP